MNRVSSILAAGALVAATLPAGYAGSAAASARPAGGSAGSIAPAGGSAGSIAPAGGSAGSIVPASGSGGSTASALGLDARESLTVRAVTTDADGTTHTHYDRRFAGLRVVGGDLIVTAGRGSNGSGGSIKEVRWGLAKKVAVTSTTPGIAPAAAIAAAGAGLGAPAGSTAQTTGRTTPTGELVVFVTDNGPRLAYDVLTTGAAPDGTPERRHTFIDAHSGKVLDGWDEVNTDIVPNASGNGILTGSVSIGTTLSGSLWQLKDSIGNTTSDLNGATSGAGTLFTDADNIWGTGSQTNRQSAAVDAQFGAEQTFNYYSSVQGRAGIRGDGKGAPSRVHFGNNYSNASWDGTYMNYGDGEMSHGVTQYTAGLVYRGEPGGLNEATSDIFGTAVEWYANAPADTPDYLIGEKIDLFGNGKPLRYLDQPSKDGSSLDCYRSRVARVDVHYSSGPLNHWYYLASEGSGAKTINGVAYNSPVCGGAPAVTGVGHVAVEKIWYRTLSTKLTSRNGYAAAREGAIASAKELYGRGSKECVAVQSAFTAIAVPAGAQTCTN